MTSSESGQDFNRFLELVLLAAKAFGTKQSALMTVLYCNRSFVTLVASSLDRMSRALLVRLSLTKQALPLNIILSWVSGDAETQAANSLLRMQELFLLRVSTEDPIFVELNPSVKDSLFSFVTKSCMKVECDSLSPYQMLLSAPGEVEPEVIETKSKDAWSKFVIARSMQDSSGSGFASKARFLLSDYDQQLWQSVLEIFQSQLVAIQTSEFREDCLKVTVILFAEVLCWVDCAAVAGGLSVNFIRLGGNAYIENSVSQFLFSMNRIGLLVPSSESRGTFCVSTQAARSLRYNLKPSVVFSSAALFVDSNFHLTLIQKHFRTESVGGSGALLGSDLAHRANSELVVAVLGLLCKVSRTISTDSEVVVEGFLSSSSIERIVCEAGISPSKIIGFLDAHVASSSELPVNVRNQIALWGTLFPEKRALVQKSASLMWTPSVYAANRASIDDLVSNLTDRKVVLAKSLRSDGSLILVLNETGLTSLS